MAIIHIKSITQFGLVFLLILAFINVSSGLLVELNDKNFDETVKDDDRWVLQFYKDECKLCERFHPHLRKLSDLPESEFGVLIKFGLINIENNPHLVSRFMATRTPQYFFIDKKRAHSFTIMQTYDYLYEFLKYRRWKLFPPRKGFSDPFSKMSKIYGYFNVIGYLLQKYVFVIIPASVFYSIIAVLFFSLIFAYGYRKHREFEEYINKFEREVQEKYYAQCQKHGYDPFALIEEMEEKMRDKKEKKKLEKAIEKDEKEELKLLKMNKTEAQEYHSKKGTFEKKK